MKKYFLIFIAVILAISLLAGCGGSSGQSSGAAGGSKAASSAAVSGGSQAESPSSIQSSSEELTASITLLDEWEKNEAVNPMYMKKGTTASIQLTTDGVPSSVKTADELVTYAQGIIKGYFSDAEFSDTSAAKVGGMDAVEYTYTITQRSMKWKFKMIYILKDGYAYTITCGALEANFDEYADEFQTMVDSYTLK